MNARSSLSVAGLVSTAAILFAALSRPIGSGPAPPGFELVERITGAEAEALVNRLHGRSVTPHENIVERYSTPGGLVIVYRSVYPSPSLASDVSDRMRFRIRTGGYGFSNYAEVHESESTVTRCSGLGRIHYLFAASHEVYWVEAEPDAVSLAWTFVSYTMHRAK